MGDHLNKSLMLIACLCLAALTIGGSAAESSEAKLKTLTGNSELNLSETNSTLFSSYDVFGLLGIGEAVKFTAPSSGFKLQKVRIVAWSGFNETSQTFPADRNIMLEIRDEDLKLLYKFADAQNNYFLSEVPTFGEIEIPEIKLSGDFYVIFYDRGAAPIVAVEVANSGNSYLFNGTDILPAEFIDQDTNESIGYDWLIEAIGE
jgi:hypothetical protein